MQTHDGFYRQVDGLAMGSPPAPMLANGWMSTFDAEIKEEAKIYSRYMDDILRDIKKNKINETLTKINELDDNLKFTLEREKDASIPFLDMRIIRNNTKLESTWYTKPTDTGLLMNFHALAPLKYKRSVVVGMIHRISRACSTQENRTESLDRARNILIRNQYPKKFVESIISNTLKRIDNPVEEQEKEDEEEDPKKLFVEYRGKISDQFKHSLQKLNAPCQVIFTLKKLKNVLPSLKPAIEKSFRSCVVYKIVCSRCQSCYVGYTCRHLITRIKEHRSAKAPVGAHMRSCDCELSIDDVEIVTSSSRSEKHLMTLEALLINQLKPELNTRDEFRSHVLTLKF